MRAKLSSFFQCPRWVVAVVITMAATLWSFSLYSIAGQIGRPFPGFFYTPDIPLPFIHGHVSFTLLCVATGIFVTLLPTN